jgi:hypothetical protein
LEELKKEPEHRLFPLYCIFNANGGEIDGGAPTTAIVYITCGAPVVNEMHPCDVILDNVVTVAVPVMATIPTLPSPW